MKDSWGNIYKFMRINLEKFSVHSNHTRQHCTATTKEVSIYWAVSSKVIVYKSFGELSLLVVFFDVRLFFLAAFLLYAFLLNAFLPIAPVSELLFCI